ncbi:DUF6089 family protein [Neolewinella litorea]|uniref:DUF6089 domain-containing protein n=1 Tax=Neolewinella litorea TaxID=2562452 RepID=A0A4S4NQE0_9BACT|nr:DUF6089 family protein [Neolewinella litorea]THH40558.1 hypothetical protein E4021_07445 [Neolewinella litorea]
MKTSIYFSLLLALGLMVSPKLAAQQYFELGVQGGDMPYNGDLSDPNLGFLKDWNTFGGFYLRYRPISRVGFRFNGIFGNIAAERETALPDETGQSITFTRDFRSKIREFNLAVELDLFYLGDPEDRFVAPYIMGGIGRTSFNPQSQIDGVYYDLQPLRTEAQGVSGGNYDPVPYELDITTIHVGGGVRAKLGERFVVGGEVSGRFTGTDYLDDVSGRRVNYIDVLSNPLSSTQGAYFSNPVVDPAEAPSDLVYARGGGSNDFYFLINLTLGIRLGNWGGGGNGCYSF